MSLWQFIDILITWAVLATWLACIALQIHSQWTRKKQNKKVERP